MGLIGGRALLTLCESNSSLNDLQLVGNNVPDDIMQSIGKECFSIIFISINLYLKIS